MPKTSRYSRKDIEDYIEECVAVTGNVPTATALRNHFQYGSLTTYSQAVKQWAAEHPVGETGGAEILKSINTPELQLSIAGQVFKVIEGKIKDALNEELNRCHEIATRAEADKDSAIGSLREAEELIEKLEAELSQTRVALQNLHGTYAEQLAQAALERGVLQGRLQEVEKENLKMKSEMVLITAGNAVKNQPKRRGRKPKTLMAIPSEEEVTVKKEETNQKSI